MPRGETRIRAKITRLKDMDRGMLCEQWMKGLKYPPPKGARNITLIRGLSYHAQEKAYGRLRASTLKRLQKIASSHAGDGCDALDAPPAGQPSPGSQLIREWNGKTHTVLVKDDGFLWSGVTYTSLSLRWRRPLPGLNGQAHASLG